MNERGAGRPAVLAWTAVLLILLGAVGLVTYALTHVSSPATAAQTAETAPGVLAALSDVRPATFDGVGVTVPGAELTPPQLISGPALESGGKPEVLFIGAEFCPFCAAERWPLIVALSRFGRFRTLHDASSTPQSVFPGTPTFSFVGNRYTSPYVGFSGVELYSDLIGPDGAFTRIAQLTGAQAALIARADASGAVTAGTAPFVDIGGRVATSTSAFSPALLAGQSQAQIADEVATASAAPTGSTPDSSVPTGRAVIAAANQLTAGICLVTGGRPAAVCQSKGVRAAAAALGTSAPVAGT